MRVIEYDVLKTYLNRVNKRMSDKEKNKEILIRRGDTVSYDGDKLYRNNIEIPKIEEDERSFEDRVKDEKQVFYDTF